MSSGSSRTGQTTGSLALYGELLAMVMVVIWGSISDFIERRTIYSVSLSLMGLATILYPYAKNVYPDLLLMRFVFSAGSAGSTTMMVALMTDTAHGTGGMVAGFVGACSGLGAIFSSFVLFFVPEWLGTLENDSLGLERGYGVIGGIAIFIAIVCWFFLPHSKREPMLPMHRRLWAGVLAVRDPRIAMGYATSFFARADEIIISNFVSLWVNQYYIDKGECRVGVSCYQAMGSTGTMTGIAQAVSLASAPLFGLMSEFLPRPLALILAGAIGAAGCFPFAFSFDPTSSSSMGFVILIAVGELGMIISGMAMLNGPHVPRNLRGSIAGVFSFVGSVGIIIVSKVGGVLLDSWMKGAPFLLLAIGHCVVGVAAFVLLLFHRRIAAIDARRAEAEKPEESTDSDQSSGYSEKWRD